MDFFMEASNMKPDQIAPKGGITLFTSILKLANNVSKYMQQTIQHHFQMHYFLLVL